MADIEKTPVGTGHHGAGATGNGPAANVRDDLEPTPRLESLLINHVLSSVEL